jgi:hypothetical protein
MDELRKWDADMLIDYLTGTASPEQRAAIEQSPGGRAAAEQLARELAPLRDILYRATCPEPDLLIAYQEQRLHDSTRHLVLRRHLAECPVCQEELALLKAIDAVPLAPAPPALKRLIEAVFVSPPALPQPIRGQTLAYQTPNAIIHVRVRRSSQHERAYALSGQVRTLEGVLAPAMIESVHVRSLDRPATDVIQGMIDAHGTFRLEGLPLGAYTLHLVTPDEELVIRQLVVGDA